MLRSLLRSCQNHPVDRFDSEGGDSAVTRWYFNVLFVFGKKHAAFKTQFPGFLLPKVVQKHYIRWDGQIKYILIASFLGDICAKIFVI